MIAAYPHIAFCLALLCGGSLGAIMGFIGAGVLRIGREADAEDEPMTDYHTPVRTKVWGGSINDGERKP